MNKLSFGERMRGYWSLVVTIGILIALIVVLTFSRDGRDYLLSDDYDQA